MNDLIKQPIESHQNTTFSESIKKCQEIKRYLKNKINVE